MNNLKPHSIEWLEFARLMNATHYFKNGIGDYFLMYQDGEDWWAYNKRNQPIRLSNVDEGGARPIDFSALDNKPSEPTVNQQLTVPVVSQEFTTEKVVSSKMETTTWDGTGLPPVGIRCYALWDSPSLYYRVRILAHDNGEAVFKWLTGPRAGEFDSSDNYECGGAASGYEIHMKFKIIKSDRERWIDAALGIRKPGAYTEEQWMQELYDAGLAKLPD